MALSELVAGMTVASALTTRATRDPGAPLLLHDDGFVTLGEIQEQADALAAGLAGLGVEAGDRVALLLPPCAELVVSLFASAKLGAVVVPLSPRLTVAELQYTLRHSEAVCVVTLEQDRQREVDYLHLFEELMPQLPELQYLVTVGEEDLWYDDRIFQFEDLLSAGGGRDYPAADIAPDDFFALVYTSGTSGKPKGVELSHANLLAAARGAAEAIGLGGDDRVVGISALHHVYGLASGLLGCLVGGAALVLQDDEGAQATLDTVERFRATVHYGIPTLFVSELALLDRGTRSVESLRLAVVAGAPVPDDLVVRLGEALEGTVVTGYSLTETASTVCASRPDDPPDKRRFTVGRPIAGTEIRVVDPDAPEVELPVESVGEIRVKGPGVMLGYYRQPKLTSEAFDVDGFFRTGDLGLIDEEGYLHLVGRLKDVIIRSGFNVYPREVEARIESHPAVQEAAAVGVPDALLGEAICACVVPVEGAIVTGQEIVEWCRETLAEEKAPDRVRFFEALPRSDTGQVRRVDLSRSVSAEGQSI